MKNLPEDPRDHYVQSENPITLKELARLYKGRKGAKYALLTQRSRVEAWVKARKEFHERVRRETDRKVAEDTAETRARLLSKLSQRHIGQTAKILNRLSRQFDKAKDTRELIALAGAIFNAQHEERLYNGFSPNTPIEISTGKGETVSALERLFGPLFAQGEASPNG